MKKDIIKTKLDPTTTRVFVKGVEITELVESFEVESITEFFSLESGFPLIEKTNVPINEKITMTVDMTISNIVASKDNDNMIIYIAEHPTDEFLAEMVRLKLRREGILNEGD